MHGIDDGGWKNRDFAVAVLLLSFGCSRAADGQQASERAEPSSEVPFFVDTRPTERPTKPRTAKPPATKLLKKRCPERVPAELDPAANATLDLALSANGVQIYACIAPKPNEAPGWTLEAPHALLTQAGQVWATHFAGPSWQWVDGSMVKGAPLAAVDAPNKSAVPWLLLSATPAGEGTFAHVTQIQRLETEGGKAPASGCDAAHVGAKVLVPYRANYYFYRARAEGETVRQCRSKSDSKSDKRKTS